MTPFLRLFNLFPTPRVVRKLLIISWTRVTVEGWFPWVSVKLEGMNFIAEIFFQFSFPDKEVELNNFYLSLHYKMIFLPNNNFFEAHHTAEYSILYFVSIYVPTI